MRFIVYVLSLISLSTLYSQNLSVSAADTICRLEIVDFINSSTDIDSVQWDFCPGDLKLSPASGSSYNITSASTNSLDEIEIVYDGANYYAFLLGLDNTLSRITIGDSLTDDPASFSNFGIVGSISSPRRLSVIQEGSVWYVFIANLVGNTVSRIDFGANIGGGISSSTNLGNINSELSQPFAIEAIELNGSFYLLVGNHSAKTVKIFDYGNSYSNPPSLINTIAAPFEMGNTTSVEVIPINNEIYLAVSGQSNGYIYSLGSSLSGTPNQLHDLSTLGSLVSPRDLDVLFDDGEIYINLISISGTYYSYRFDEDWNFLAYNNYGQISILSDTRSLSFGQQNSQWTGFSVNRSSNRELVLISYPNECNGSEKTSSEIDPMTLAYDSLGFSYYTVNGFSNGNRYHLRDSIFVKGVESAFFSSNFNCSNANTSFNSLPIVAAAEIVSYSWDFGDPSSGVLNTSILENPEHTFTAPGDYNVFLQVIDECGIAEDTTLQITIFDENDLMADFESTTSSYCINTTYQFNDISTFTDDIPQSWLWRIDGANQSTDQNPMLNFTNSGNVTIELVVTGISGCVKTSQQVINVSSGPTSSFFAASVCQGEAMQFNNTSTNADSYFWDFGDGFTSTNENPSHIFGAAGNYDVTLTATDLDGCDASLIVEVAVSDIPQINFDYDVACTTVNGIQFSDLTTVDNADLVAWTWFVDDVQVSTDQSPRIMFSSSGTKTIRLDVESSNGCQSSYSEDVDVLISPTPDFNVNLGCQGEISSFTDNTTSAGNSIVSWLWTVDGVNYGTQDIDHVFADAGTYDVTLEVTGQNFCSESITKSVEVIALPTVSFSVNGECDNQLIRATDQSTESSDLIVDRRWMLDGANVGNGSQLVLPSLEDASYELALELETQAGCIISASQTLVINDAPSSSFTSSRTYGIPNDRLVFSNTSSGGTSYQWLLDGQVTSTDSQMESITFNQAGTYDVSLVVQNSLGCNDTTTQQILIAVPEVDLAIGSFELVEENNVGRIFLEVQNLSNLPVESIEARIVLENTFTITEQINDFIDIGETSLVSLDVGIPLTISEPSYFCVNLTSPYSDYTDISPVNNEKCLTINPIIQVEDPFPNPVTDQFRLKLVVNESSAAKVSLINSAGKLKTSQTNEVTQGLNNFFIDVSTLDPGIYYVIVEVLGTTHRRKIIKL